MCNQLPVQIAAVTILAVLSVTLGSAQQLKPRSDPAKGFNPRAVHKISRKAVSTTLDPGRVNPASPILALTQHGNVNGGADQGYTNVGVVFGARIYTENLVQAVELFYYIPSNSDNYYREGDYRGSTGRIGRNSGTDNGEYYCPDGYAAVGLQGGSGLAIDRVGLVCGQIGDLSKVTSLPIFGGNGGNAFYDNCVSTRSLGFLTGVRVRSGGWMDSIQGLCQASPSGDSETPMAKAETAVKLADDLAASIAVGAGRNEVLQKLGEPYSKISGDSERFIYQLQSGATLRIELEDGRVTKIQSAGGH
ncbi:MAG: hypothetical protein ABSH09_15925 [Bryobacteraceae bacterium]|jgi:hypothetical protein